MRSFVRHLIYKPGSYFFPPFFSVSKQGPCLTAIERDGGGKRLAQLELVKPTVSLRQILFNQAIAAIAEAVLMRISAKQVLSWLLEVHETTIFLFKTEFKSNQATSPFVELHWLLAKITVYYKLAILGRFPRLCLFSSDLFVMRSQSRLSLSGFFFFFVSSYKKQVPFNYFRAKQPFRSIVALKKKVAEHWHCYIPSY